jgi:hypothetical protein
MRVEFMDKMIPTKRICKASDSDDIEVIFGESQEDWSFASGLLRRHRPNRFSDSVLVARTSQGHRGR